MEKSKYLTKDLGEAAALMASGVKFIGLKNGNGFYWFVFDSLEVAKNADNYWSGELLVKAKNYYDSMRTLKDRIYSQ